MNKPLEFDEYKIYQQGYQEGELKNITFKVHEKNDPEERSLGEVTIDLNSPEETYELDNGFTLNILQYYPEYEMEDGEPRTTSNVPRNPAFIMELLPPNENEGELSFVGVGMNVDPTEENTYQLSLADLDTNNVSGVIIRKDRTLPFFIIGAIVFMIGVTQGLYWQHRRIWIKPEDDGILLAAHTNKNWTGVKRDISKIIEGTNVQMVVDQEEIKTDTKPRRTETI